MVTPSKTGNRISINFKYVTKYKSLALNCHNITSNGVDRTVSFVKISDQINHEPNILLSNGGYVCIPLLQRSTKPRNFCRYI